MSDISANLSLPFVQPAQAQKHVTVNEALLRLDALVQLGVADRTLTTPPRAVTEGARYIVPAGATGDWAGHENKIALRTDVGWQFFSPQPGWCAYVLSEGAQVAWKDGAWQPVGIAGSLPLLGINGSADTTNRLTVASDAVLLTHAGSDQMLKVNKATSGDTASLLFQSGWTGHAEMGLAGSNDFAVKVSADGATWFKGLSVAAATGVAHMAQGAKIDGALGGSAVLGTVGRSGGQPAGALFERGSNADGTYMRFTDGTQICLGPDLALGAVDMPAGALYRSASQGWSFPAAFATGSRPVVTGEAGSEAAWLSVAPHNETAASVTALSWAPQPPGLVARLMAVGRWV